MTTAQQVAAVKAKLAAAKTPMERLAVANDPANGPFGVRCVAYVEHGKATS